MAITKAAKKSLRQSIRRRTGNLVHRNRIRDFVKKARFLVSQKKIKEAKELLPQIYKALDKAAKVNVIKKNTASRLKSRVTKLTARLQ